MKCEYGCGKEACYQMTSGKWCCSPFYTQCSKNRKKNSDRNTGKKRTKEQNQRSSDFRKGKTYEELMGVEKAREQRELKSKQGKRNVGENNPMYGKKHTEESAKKN